MVGGQFGVALARSRMFVAFIVERMEKMKCDSSRMQLCCLALTVGRKASVVIGLIESTILSGFTLLSAELMEKH